MVAALDLLVVTGVILLACKGRSPNLATIVDCVLLILAYTLVALIGVMKPGLDPFARFAPTIILTLFGCMAVAYFALALYPSIPASLGGGRLRFVVLDIQSSSVAPETLRMLLPPSASIRPGTAVRTRELDLVTAPGQYYLVEIPSLQAGSPPVRLQLERSSVVAVIWTK